MVLERLTKSRALVMRHVYSKRLEYMEFISAKNIVGLLVILALITLWVLIRQRKKAILSTAIFLLVGLALFWETTKSLLTYPYLLMALIGVWSIENIKVYLKLNA